MLLSLKAETDDKYPYYENEFFISEIYPNPFKKETTVVYYVPGNCYISLKIYDVTGRLIQTKNIGSTTEGKHRCVLNMDKAAPGIY